MHIGSVCLPGAEGAHLVDAFLKYNGWKTLKIINAVSAICQFSCFLFHVQWSKRVTELEIHIPWKFTHSEIATLWPEFKQTSLRSDTKFATYHISQLQLTNRLVAWHVMWLIFKFPISHSMERFHQFLPTNLSYWWNLPIEWLMSHLKISHMTCHATSRFVNCSCEIWYVANLVSERKEVCLNSGHNVAISLDYRDYRDYKDYKDNKVNRPRWHERTPSGQYIMNLT